jgi:hypothetical protein
VPEQFAALDQRRKVSLSTGIRVADDPRAFRARQAVQEFDARLQRFWRQKRDGKDASAEQRYRDAVRRARELDIPYLPNHELTKLPLQDLWKRFLILTASCPETQLMSGLIDEKTRKELESLLAERPLRHW